MISNAGDFSLGITFTAVVYLLGNWGLSYTGPNIPFHSAEVMYQIRQCEKDLPRNQECEIIITAVVKEEKK